MTGAGLRTRVVPRRLRLGTVSFLYGVSGTVVFRRVSTGMILLAFFESLLRDVSGSKTHLLPPLTFWSLCTLAAYPVVAFFSAGNLGYAACRDVPVTWQIFWAPVFYLGACCVLLTAAAIVEPQGEDA